MVPVCIGPAGQGRGLGWIRGVMTFCEGYEGKGPFKRRSKAWTAGQEWKQHGQ